jgi:hypothetical protein
LAAKRMGCAPTVVRDKTTHQCPRGKLPHATSFVGGTMSHQERGRSTRGARSEEGAARRWVGGGSRVGMKTVRIFSDRIRDRICLERF